MPRNSQKIMHEMHIPQSDEITSTSVSKVECYVCGRGLQDGYSITAKTLLNGTVLFCDDHYMLQ